MYPSVKLSPYPEYNAYIPQVNSNLRSAEDAKYIVTTKIMVLALAVLFAVVFFVVCLHIYAKWIWSTTNPAAARGLSSFSFWRPRRRNRDEVVDALNDINMVNMGLGTDALEALPKFRYEECEERHLECPICLGKFEEGEMGRTLPKCAHCFHLECIDMWLFSHSTCPLCRAVLDPDRVKDEGFHLEPPPPEPPAEPPLPEDDKRDSIPANVLFWGNHSQAGPPSQLELIRLSINNNHSSAAPSPAHVVIDVEQAGHDSQLLPRGGNLHRLLGRGARVGNVVVTPFRPSPSPLPSTSSSSSSSRVSGHGGVHSAEEP